MRILMPALLASVVSAAAAAQTVETPQPFDSAHRVMAVTPGLAERLHLQGPLWPASGLYREARLYSIEPGGGFVLVVLRPSGVVERYALTDAQRATLSVAIDSATALAGRPGGETSADVVSEPAGNAFARTQLGLGAAIYGPLAASLADDPSLASGLYLLVAGGSFFVAYGAAEQGNITRAQSTLGAGLGLAAGTGGWLAGFAATGGSEKGVRFISLASAIAGTIVGVNVGRTMSDAEAHSGIQGVETGAVAALDASAAIGASSRTVAAVSTVGGAIGLPFGLQYPRRASYNVTAGDAQSIGTAGLVGALVGAAFAGGEHTTSRRVDISLATGYLAGAFAGEQGLARKYDLSQSQANLLRIGAAAGALIGVAIPALASSGDQAFYFGAAGVGGAIGLAGLAASFPNGVSTDGASPRGGRRFRSLDRFRVDVPFASVLGLASRRPGAHPLVHIAF